MANDFYKMAIPAVLRTQMPGTGFPRETPTAEALSSFGQVSLQSAAARGRSWVPLFGILRMIPQYRDVRPGYHAPYLADL